MFALLPPGGKLNRHRDPFAGSLRYHLGLVTPNSDTCRIYVDGEPYSWRDGEDLMFDETFIHSAENATRHDAHHPVLRRRAAAAHARDAGGQPVRQPHGHPRGVDAEHRGRADRRANRIYALLGRAATCSSRLKRRNRTVFRAVKYALIAALAYWIFVY